MSSYMGTRMALLQRISDHSQMQRPNSEVTLLTHFEIERIDPLPLDRCFCTSPVNSQHGLSSSNCFVGPGDVGCSLPSRFHLFEKRKHVLWLKAFKTCKNPHQKASQLWNDTQNQRPGIRWPEMYKVPPWGARQRAPLEN